MATAEAICPKCARAISANAAKGLCSHCLVSSLFDDLGEESGQEAPPMPAPAQEHQRLGDYELLDQLGRGGMGVVFRARDLRLHRVVALKLILTGRLASALEVKRFRAEAEAAAQLEHPHIVPIYEVGEAEGRHYFAMQWVEGGSLVGKVIRHQSSVISHQSRRPAGGAPNTDSPMTGYSPRAGVALMAKIARAVHHAHQRGILHRDIKPGNILLTAQGEPMVTDFGLARRIEGNSELTVSGTVVGSPSYMAPEQARGNAGEVTTAADIYSLGAVLYELLAGRPPFLAATALETMRLVLEEEPVPPSKCEGRSGREEENRQRLSLRPSDLSPDLETICLKCLEKNPVRRYASAAELADDLERWLRGEPILARPGGVASRLWKWAKRRPTSAALAVVSVAALAGFLVLQQFNEARLEQQRDKAQTQEKLARASEQSARLSLYASDMFLSARALEQGNLALARRTLAAHVPRAGEEDLRGFEWRYYWQQAQGQQERVLIGFSNAVNCVAFSPDGRWLAAGGGNLVQKWETTNFTLAATLRHDPKFVVNSLVFSPDGTSLWAGDTRGRVNVWMEGFDRPVGELTRGTGFVSLAAPAGRLGQVAIGVRNGTEGGAVGQVALYGWMDMLQRNERGNLLPASGGLASFSDDGRWLLTGGGGDRAKLHDLKTGAENSLPGWTGMLMALALSPDGRRAVVSPGNGTGIALYDLSSSNAPVTSVSLTWRCRALAFSPDGASVAAASYDHTIRLLHAGVGTILHRYDGHTDQVLGVAFSPDGKLLASAGKDGTVRLWDPAAGKRNLRRGIFPPFTLAPDGKHIIGATSDDWSGVVHEHELALPAAPAKSWWPLSPERFPDITQRHQGLLHWRRYGGATAEQWAQTEQFIARQGSRIVWEPTADLATYPTGRRVRGVKGASASSADGRVLALADKNKVRLWDNFASRRLPDLQPSPRGILQLALSEDGHTLAVAGASNVVALWDTATGTNRFTFPPRPDLVHDLAFSPDGRTLALAGDDTTVQLWSTENGLRLATLAGHEVGVLAVAFSPDGRTLVSLSSLWMKLWHLPTGREVGSLSVGADRMVFARDGSLLVLASWDGGARLLNAPFVKGASEGEKNSR